MVASTHRRYVLGMRPTPPLAVGVGLLVAGCAHPRWDPQTACARRAGGDYDLVVGERHAVVHHPPGAGRAAPVVLDLHYLGGSPAGEDDVNELRDAADERGWIVVQPSGLDGAWNAGPCCGEPWKRGVDDVAFADALLDELEAASCVDPGRVYAVGFSSGGMMAQTLGCELSPRLAAIASVAAPLHSGGCQPEEPLGVIMIAGTDDPLIPFEGGRGWTPFGVAGDLQFRSSDASFAEWQRLNGCEEPPEDRRVSEHVQCRRYRCEGEVAVERCVVEGGGHAWPGGESPLPLPSPLVFGVVSDELDATAAILDFFAEHRRPRARFRAASATLMR